MIQLKTLIVMKRQIIIKAKMKNIISILQKEATVVKFMNHKIKISQIMMILN